MSKWIWLWVPPARDASRTHFLHYTAHFNLPRTIYLFQYIAYNFIVLVFPSFTIIPGYMTIVVSLILPQRNPQNPWISPPPLPTQLLLFYTTGLPFCVPATTTFPDILNKLDMILDLSIFSLLFSHRCGPCAGFLSHHLPQHTKRNCHGAQKCQKCHPLLRRGIITEITIPRPTR